MENKDDIKAKLKAFYANKKLFYAIVGLVLLIIIGGLISSRMENGKKAREQAVQLEKQKEEQQLQKKATAATNRINFFLNAPAGARAGMNISNYWEGSYRIPDTINEKMTVLYIKNGASSPVMSMRYYGKKDFKLEPGEQELKTSSSNYAYAYYVYPANSYAGADKQDFISMQKDFQEALKTFAIF